MNLTEGLLIAVIILLTVLIWRRQSSRAGGSSGSRMWNCTDSASGDTTTVRMNYSGTPLSAGAPVSATAPGVGSTAPESSAQKENSEFFATCQDPTEVKKDMSCVCGDDDTFTYAVTEYGAPGMSYKDWVASAAVDDAVIQNHRAFVKDRLKDKVDNVTGPTYSPDMNDSYDPIPWIGLRRPQAVATCNPTQVPDIDKNLYEKTPKFTWRSS